MVYPRASRCPQGLLGETPRPPTYKLKGPAHDESVLLTSNQKGFYFLLLSVSTSLAARRMVASYMTGVPIMMEA